VVNWDNVSVASNRNPAYDRPDEHELALMELLASSHPHFKLIPSTRAQRRWRAWYKRKRTAAIAASGSADTARSGEPTRETAIP
jgi:hypothetical protein